MNTRSLRSRVVLVACILVAAGCVRVTRTRDADVVRIDGSAGVMPLVASLARAYRAQHPTATIELGAGLGSRARLDSLTSGRIDIALASIPVAREEMERRGFAAHEIARVAVVFGVNGAVRVNGLTQQQVCDVFARRTTNWNQLGDADLPVAARTRPPGEVDGDVAVAGVACLKTAIASGAPKSIDLPDAMSAELATVAGAIGMTSLPFVEQSGGRIRALQLDGIEATPTTVRSGAYPLARLALLLTRADASPATARFLAFVRSAEGATVIATNGGVAVQ